MADLAHGAPKIDWDDLAQVPALPLGSRLKTDPWDDKVHMLNAKMYAPMNARDKMPLEVTPVYFKLQRYDAARLNPPAAPGTPGTAPAQPATAPPAEQPEDGQPAAPPPAQQQAPGDAAAQQPSTTAPSQQ